MGVENSEILVVQDSKRKLNAGTPTELIPMKKGPKIIICKSEENPYSNQIIIE